MTSKDQEYSAFQSRAHNAHQHRSSSQRSNPPPLPPRASSAYLSPHVETPPPYSQFAGDDSPQTQGWTLRGTDPRTSSTQSLCTLLSGPDGRRKLLLIYIHGFMGTETSFQSFPAHVHNLLAIRLRDTHVVHTKIYPRYKSKRAIEFARNDFSNWLAPHESPDTDVVLVGHSMGGLLAAEVVLLPSRSLGSGQPLRHRILGTINLDTPFLGMHPGVVVSGIASLFRPAPDTTSRNTVETDPLRRPSSPLASPPPTSIYSDGSSFSSPAPSTSNNSSSYFLTQPADPNYNPSFPNDVRLAMRKGWDSKVHFVAKHYSEGLRRATKEYVLSHLEFGGCMADYPGLKARYSKIRTLEEPNVSKYPGAVITTGLPPRVRFVNYYTASSGYPKKANPPDTSARETEGDMLQSPTAQLEGLSLQPEAMAMGSGSRQNLGVEQYSDKADIPDMAHIDPSPLVELSDLPSAPDGFDAPVAQASFSTDPVETPPMVGAAIARSSELERSASLPPIPPPPPKPSAFIPTAYHDQDERKIAEKEHKRLVKAYERAVKDRDKAIRDRDKLQEKRDRKYAKEQAKELKESKKEQVQAGKIEKKKRDRKFCMLPPKDANENRDPTWVRIYMEGVDEVAAHCGLFFMSETYEHLVSDVAERVIGWVNEDAKTKWQTGPRDERAAHLMGI